MSTNEKTLKMPTTNSNSDAPRSFDRLPERPELKGPSDLPERILFEQQVNSVGMEVQKAMQAIREDAQAILKEHGALAAVVEITGHGDQDGIYIIVRDGHWIRLGSPDEGGVISVRSNGSWSTILLGPEPVPTELN